MHEQLTNHRHLLSQAQEKELKQLLLQAQILPHPEIPNATKGLDGLIVADEILKQRNACGFVVGSLSKAVWNARRTKEELAWHYDTDVIVPDFSFELEKPFEGGIDWWLPKNCFVEYSNTFGGGKLFVDFYENGNGCIFPGTLKKQYDLEPGLHIPGRESVIDGYLTAALVKSGKGDVLIDSDNLVFEEFRNKLRKSVKTRVPKFIEKPFEGKILELEYGVPYYKTCAFQVQGFIPEVYSQILNGNVIVNAPRGED